MSGKPFKMKGSPFQRNFGIGRTESPDAPSPINDTDKTHVTHPKSKVRMHDDGSIHSPAKGLMEGLGKIDLKGAAQAALSQLPGGKIASSEETTGYEKNKDGSLKVDKDGNPIPIKTESKSESKPYTIKDMFGNVRDFLSKKETGPEDPKHVKKIKDDTEEIEESLITMKGSPAKHPWPGADPSKPHGHEASDIYKENKEKQKEKEEKKKEKEDKENKKK